MVRASQYAKMLFASSLLFLGGSLATHGKMGSPAVSIGVICAWFAGWFLRDAQFNLAKLAAPALVALTLVASAPAQATTYGTYNDWNNATTGSQVYGDQTFFDRFATAFRNTFGIPMGKTTYVGIPTVYGKLAAPLDPKWMLQEGINPNTRKFFKFNTPPGLGWLAGGFGSGPAANPMENCGCGQQNGGSGNNH